MELHCKGETNKYYLQRTHYIRRYEFEWFLGLCEEKRRTECVVWNIQLEFYIAM